MARCDSHLDYKLNWQLIIIVSAFFYLRLGATGPGGWVKIITAASIRCF